MNKISTQRKKLGISQAKLAAHLGWGQSRISNYELGIRTPSLCDCRSIVAAFNELGSNCSLDDLFPSKYGYESNAMKNKGNSHAPNQHADA
ncbi:MULTISPECIES: helix-turn-helix transcriptional regulator [Proteus]|uniref:helix-turn-helix transcriptional regulator n=1 Tax=Proteus TaxID=583 RepID=UPI000952A22E|nr:MULTISPECIES: helix-turn-helix transcriptional regulator [Proteus]MBI6327091.1 helix-turn-helix transcriptional regulator [Proteus mirabilis]MBI6454551.1 helix-turn-helix transcriptional regulator [Proteus mirabilis]NGX90983.1 helix-turn-helix transcriptional regulator [Proteus mirabilis]WCG89582.1 helix-turn-helix transcriptional regulator [Proteus terrae]HCU0052510.1 helix-turn-helix transcriptional regulator [Proteus mirabilis]